MTTSNIKLKNLNRKSGRELTVKKILNTSILELNEEPMIPEELETWHIDELEDILPSHGALTINEFEIPIAYIDSVDQIIGIHD